MCYYALLYIYMQKYRQLGQDLFKKGGKVDILKVNRLVKAVKNYEIQTKLAKSLDKSDIAAPSQNSSKIISNEINSINKSETIGFGNNLIKNVAPPIIPINNNDIGSIDNDVAAPSASIISNKIVESKMDIDDGQQNNNILNNQVHVIISPAEHDSIEKLKKRFDKTTKLIDDLQKCDNIIETAIKAAKIDANNKFDELINALKARKKTVIDEMDEIGKTKKVKLNEQMNNVFAYKFQIDEGKKEYERLISDPKIDINKRKQRILSMTESILNCDVKLTMVTQPTLKLNYNDDKVKLFINSLCIDSCDEPKPPALIIDQINYDTVDISWEFDDNSIEKKIIEYQVQYAKFKKDKTVKVKKTKKRKKKKKKKKRSRYDSSSDDSSDSSDESSDDRYIIYV